jgi:hypothetical protein
MKLLTPEQRHTAKLIRKATYILFLITIFLLGYYLYIGLSEMRLTGHILNHQLKLPSQVTIIQPIQSQFDSLILKYRQLLMPLIREQFKVESEIAHYRSILKKTHKKITPIETQLTEIQIQLLNHNTNNTLLASALKEIGEEQLRLDQEYRLRIEEFAALIRKRAQIQNLKLILDNKTPLTSDKIVNAFRISLYSPPPNLNVNEERQWLQRALQIWENYEIQWTNQKNALQEKRKKIHTRFTLEALKKQESEAIQKLEELQITLQQAQKEQIPLRQKLYSISVQIHTHYEKFNIEIQNLPVKNKIIDLPLSPNGTFTWSNLTDANLILPGSYVLWAQAQKNNTTYWTLQHFYLQAHANTHIVIQETAFQPIHDIIPILHQP